jgi:hypothetical protein
VYANGQFLAFHAAQDGPLTIDTGRSGAVYDAVTDELVGSGPTLTMTVKKGNTRVLRLLGPAFGPDKARATRPVDH